MLSRGEETKRGRLTRHTTQATAKVKNGKREEIISRKSRCLESTAEELGIPGLQEWLLIVPQSSVCVLCRVRLETSGTVVFSEVVGDDLYTWPVPACPLRTTDSAYVVVFIMEHKSYLLPCSNNGKYSRGSPPACCEFRFP